MNPWTFYDFLDARGNNTIRAWLDSLPEKASAKIDARILFMRLPSQIAGASSSTSSVKEQLVHSLSTSKEYRHSFVEEKIRTGLAAQIKAIREHSGLTQERFARMLGRSQSWVARLEDPNARPPTLSTLLQVARAFDVDLEVRFAPFSELVDWLSRIPHLLPGLSEESLAVPDFEHDAGLAAEAAERVEEGGAGRRRRSAAKGSSVQSKHPGHRSREHPLLHRAG
jgi:transcriptional regulator with XRE-family HTH domain